MSDQPGGRRFKPQALELEDGSKLVLGADGSIDHIDEHGSKMHSWSPDDPKWPDRAIRFGLHPQARTVAPHGQVQGTKPPRR
jgi:hypothetical protein